MMFSHDREMTFGKNFVAMDDSMYTQINVVAAPDFIGFFLS